MLSLWARHPDCREEIRVQLAGISGASIDRLLRGFKVSAGKKARQPKPASAVKALVEVRAQSWVCERGGGFHPPYPAILS